MHDIHQADRINVKDRGRVRIITHLWRIPGDAKQIAQSDRVCAQQITLDAEHIAITARVMQDGLDITMLLDQQ